MEDIERIKTRLDNIQSVEPIITSLRTIAAGGWRLSLRNTQASRQYVDHLSRILAPLLPRMSAAALHKAHVHAEDTQPQRPLMLVIASERGLCGAFNEVVLDGADQLIAQQQVRSETVLVATLGSRATAHFRSSGRELHSEHALPVTRVASFELVREIGKGLMADLEGREIDAVYVVFSPYQTATLRSPVSRLWMPIEPSSLPDQVSDVDAPIIASDRGDLFARALEEWTYTRLYQFVMESAASEQAARYRAMEAASGNLARIIDELTLSYHAARQHAITMEMLDLVAGAGILQSGSRPRVH